MQYLSDRALEVLAVIADLDGADGWGEVYTQWCDRRSARAGHLEMANFDRIATGLEKRGAISVDQETGVISVTDWGKRLLSKGVG